MIYLLEISAKNLNVHSDARKFSRVSKKNTIC